MSRIVFSTGYRENYWGTNWFTAKQIGGSENMVVQLATSMAAQGHEVIVRLPYRSDTLTHRGVYWVGQENDPLKGDVLFCFDDFDRRDTATRTVLVACRSDPPPMTNFDEMIFLSRHHAKLMGHPDRPSIGGGVHLSDYKSGMRRTPGLVICTSSPDRCMAAFEIGPFFKKFVFTYKPVQGLPPTKQVTREELITLQKQAKALIYPLDPSRPSDFFSMAVLEALAAGTPVVVSDADSMPELWGDTATVLSRPIRVSKWVEVVDDLIANTVKWKRMSEQAKKKAADYDWAVVARKYLKVAGTPTV